MAVDEKRIADLERRLFELEGRYDNLISIISDLREALGKHWLHIMLQRKKIEGLSAAFLHLLDGFEKAFKPTEAQK
jgi:uncharacterized coiled-coil protein SlyX